jgi:hypothetical protein
MADMNEEEEDVAEVMADALEEEEDEVDAAEQAEMDDLERNNIHPDTRKCYGRKVQEMTEFFYARYPKAELVTEETNDDGEKYLLLHLERVRQPHFKHFLAQLKGKHGKGTASYAKASKYRSAINKVFAEDDSASPPDDWERKNRLLLAAIGRRTAQERRDGVRKLIEGKDALPWALYMWMAEELSKEGDTFFWCFLVTLMHTMARPNNIGYD